MGEAPSININLCLFIPDPYKQLIFYIVIVINSKLGLCNVLFVFSGKKFRLDKYPLPLKSELKSSNI